MNILLTSPFYPGPAHPYAGLFVHQQLLALHVIGGARFSLQTFHPYAPYVLGLFNKRWKAMTRARSTYAFESIQVRSQPVLTLPRNMSLGFSRLQMEHALRKTAKRVRPDLIHAHFAYPLGLAAVRVAQELGVPSVLTVHGSDIERVPRLGETFTAAVRESLQSASIVLAASESLRRQCHDLSGVQATTLYTGVDVSNVRPDSNERCLDTVSHPHLLFVGNLVDSKGVMEAVLSLLHIRRARLTLVGDGPIRDALERLILKHGLVDRVELLGQKMNADVRSLMAEADVLVVPSHREGLGMVVLEAFEAGLPVIASRVGGLPELVHHRDTGLLIRPHDPQDLAMAVEWLVDHPFERAQMIRNAKRLLIQRFDVVQNARTLHGIYKRLA